VNDLRIQRLQALRAVGNHRWLVDYAQIGPNNSSNLGCSCWAQNNCHTHLMKDCRLGPHLLYNQEQGLCWKCMLLGHKFFGAAGLELLIRYGVMRGMIGRNRQPGRMRTFLNITKNGQPVGIDRFLYEYIAETATNGRLGRMSMDDALDLAFCLDSVNTAIELGEL